MAIFISKKNVPINLQTSRLFYNGNDELMTRFHSMNKKALTILLFKAHKPLGFIPVNPVFSVSHLPEHGLIKVAFRAKMKKLFDKMSYSGAKRILRLEKCS